MQDISKTKTAVEQLIARYVEAWGRGDGPAFASVFADDAEFTSIRRDRLHNRREIADGHSEIFATFYKGTRIRADVESLRMLRPDLALFHVDAYMTDASGAPFGPRHAHAMAVAEQRPEGWQIIAFHNLAVPS
jgi:uncharacterized protein (TIGR02246 family)